MSTSKRSGKLKTKPLERNVSFVVVLENYNRHSQRENKKVTLKSLQQKSLGVEKTTNDNNPELTTIRKLKNRLTKFQYP